MKISDTATAWLHGLLSAFIGSFASSAIVILTAPGTYNIYTLAGWGHIGVVALVGGIATVLTYLKQSPLPAMTTLNLSQSTDPQTGIKTTVASVSTPSETTESK